MPTRHPVPVFHFVVEWGSSRVTFSEVTGLTQADKTTEHRGSSVPDYSSIKMPGLRKFANVTLKRGVVTGDDQFSRWLSGVKANDIERRDLVIRLMNEQHRPVKVWKVVRAFPVKVEGPELKASGNEVAIESIEIAHEGLELQNEETPPCSRC